MPPQPDLIGRFITLEGPDGSGKTTQADSVARRLRAAGHAVRLVREPGGTAVGERIRELLLGRRELAIAPVTDALLFNAARAQLVAEVIRPALAAGEPVLCVRFADSTLAYQGYGEGVDLDLLRRLAAISTGGLTPDLTILLDVSPEVGLRRRSRGRPSGVTRFEAERDLTFHARVRAGFLALAAAEPERWRMIDASRARAEVAAAIVALVEEALSRPSRSPR